MLLNMRTSIPVSQDASARLKILQELHTLGRSVLHMHKDEMQSPSEPPTAPHSVRGEKVTIVTKNLFIRRHPNRKLRDR
jgi:nitrate reductase cytochrome c-type subunit